MGHMVGFLAIRRSFFSLAQTIDLSVVGTSVFGSHEFSTIRRSFFSLAQISDIDRWDAIFFGNMVRFWTIRSFFLVGSNDWLTSRPLEHYFLGRSFFWLRLTVRPSGCCFLFAWLDFGQVRGRFSFRFTSLGARRL